MTTRDEENSPDRSQGCFEEVTTDVPQDGNDPGITPITQARTPRFQMSATFQQPTKPQAPVALRVGRLNHPGCWTGFGLNSKGVEPCTADCMHEFFHDGIKKFNALGEIQKCCCEGLSSNQECPRFCQAHEKGAHQFVKCIQELKRFCEEHGLEGVF